MNKVVRPWRGVATSPPPERKGTLMMDDDRSALALPEGIDSKAPAGPLPGPQPRERASAAEATGKADRSQESEPRSPPARLVEQAL